MAKDPAFLFYSNDFLTGTIFLSDEQVGKYIRLLCLQHQKGHLTEKQMVAVCKEYDKEIYDNFKKDEQGLYYNERLDIEKDKRGKFTSSRRKNLNSDKNNKTDTHMGTHMDKHMENENENEIVNKDISINIDKKNNFDDADFWEFYNSFESKSDIDKTFFKWQSTNIMDKGFIKNHYPKFHIITEEKFRGTALGYLEKRKWKTEINGKMYISNNGTEYEVKPDFSVFVDNQTIILNEEQRKKCYYK